ncbi:hypothetical protein SAMN05216407_1209 [Streptococcus equinus]|jgi:ABC-type transport system involved in multi-copper enzyme maturation permease subunit|nr:hypothetical protein SAMN05216407_1209 [Streptococcus equinus]
MCYSIFVILYCIILAVIAIDGFSIKKSRKTSTYVCFLIFYYLTQKEGTTTPLSIVCLLVLMLIYYENRDIN